MDPEPQVFVAPPGTVCTGLLDELLHILPRAASSWRRFAAYFRALAAWLDLGPDMLAFALQCRNALELLLDFVVGDEGGDLMTDVTTDVAAGRLPSVSVVWRCARVASRYWHSSVAVLVRAGSETTGNVLHPVSKTKHGAHPACRVHDGGCRMLSVRVHFSTHHTLYPRHAVA